MSSARLSPSRRTQKTQDGIETWRTTSTTTASTVAEPRKPRTGLKHPDACEFLTEACGVAEPRKPRTGLKHKWEIDKVVVSDPASLGRRSEKTHDRIETPRPTRRIGRCMIRVVEVSQTLYIERLASIYRLDNLARSPPNPAESVEDYFRILSSPRCEVER